MHGPELNSIFRGFLAPKINSGNAPVSAHWHIHYLCVQQKHQGAHHHTKDTIRKKMFPTVLSCICVFVYLLKKSQPYSIRYS